jgi:Protein of unknown function (DUF2510)
MRVGPTSRGHRGCARDRLGRLWVHRLEEIGDGKGRGGLGAFLGVVLGLIGIVIIAAIPTKKSSYDAAYAVPGSRPTTTPAAVPGEGWYPDRFGRHPERWWDGAQWTKWVRSVPGGTPAEDPPVYDTPSLRRGPS